MNNPTGEQSQLDQMTRNFYWLLARMDAVHAALCPGKIATWQQRAEQAVEAAGAAAEAKRIGVEERSLYGHGPAVRLSRKPQRIHRDERDRP